MCSLLYLNLSSIFCLKLKLHQCTWPQKPEENYYNCKIFVVNTCLTSLYFRDSSNSHQSLLEFFILSLKLNAVLYISFLRVTPLKFSEKYRWQIISYLKISLFILHICLYADTMICKIQQKYYLLERSIIISDPSGPTMLGKWEYFLNTSVS